jgi:hypothetical protein
VHIHTRLTVACRIAGLRAPDQLHAVRIDPNVSGTATGAYIAKGGEWTPAEEMTRGDLKTSRAGSRRDRDLWCEYSRVTRGLAAVRWSRGLRAVILGPIAESAKTDAELASEEIDGELLASFPSTVWACLRQSGLDHAILVAAERGDTALTVMFSRWPREAGTPQPL